MTDQINVYVSQQLWQGTKYLVEEKRVDDAKSTSNRDV
jgi:hypothetical protein